MDVVFRPALLTIIREHPGDALCFPTRSRRRQRGQRLYLDPLRHVPRRDGRGPAATIFLMRPGNLAIRVHDRLPDDYLFTLIKNGATIASRACRPRYHLKDDEIRELIRTYAHTSSGSASEAEGERANTKMNRQ